LFERSSVKDYAQQNAPSVLLSWTDSKGKGWMMREQMLAQDSIGSFVSSVPEKLDLTDMTQYERLGFIGESFFNSELKSVAKEFGLRVVWSGKQSYDKKRRNEFRRGVDFKLYDKNGQLFWANENKNLKNPKNQYSLETAQNVIVERFNDVPHAKHKSVSLPNFNVFNYQARQHVESQGIEVFELNKLIGAKDFRSKNFHVIRAKLREFIHGLIAKDNRIAQLKEQEHKKLTEYINQQEQNKHNSLAEFLLSLVSYDNIVVNTVNTKEIVDRPIENTELTIDNVKHPNHESWLNSEIERLEKADTFRKLNY